MHRLSTIKQMDRIIVVDYGKIVEVGKQAALIQLIEKWLGLQGYKAIYAARLPEFSSVCKKNGYMKMPFDDPDESSSDTMPLGKILC